jgi:integrase
VSGYSRGIEGSITFVNATKTTSMEDDEVTLPFLQPSMEIACEVARFLKARVDPKERVCKATPKTFYRHWKRICSETGIRFVRPHGWKHSYATIGAENLQAWYNGDPRLLQLCCLHSSFSMTEKYIKKRYSKSLSAWAPKKS